MIERETPERETPSVRLLHDVRKEDLIALTNWVFKDSFTREFASKKSLWKWLAVGCVVAFGAVFLTGSQDVWRPSPALVQGLLIAAAIIVVFVFFFVRALKKTALPRDDEKSKNRGIFGWHELTIEDGKLKERTEVSEASHRLDGNERVASTESHTFIFLNSAMAHVIPHNSVREGDQEAFVNSLEGAIAKAKAG